MNSRGNIAIGRRLKELRIKAGKSQVEVAAAIGISRGHVSAIETGQRPIGRETLMAFAELFGTSLDFIASRMGETGASAAKNELEAAVLLITRELPHEEVEAWVSLMMARLRDRLKTS